MRHSSTGRVNLSGTAPKKLSREAGRRTRNLFLNAVPVAREGRTAAGSGHIAAQDCAMKIAQPSHYFIAPGAVDFGFLGVARPLQFKLAPQTTGEYLVRCDPFRRMAESEMQIQGSFPGTLASGLRVKNFSSSRCAESLVAPSVHGELGILCGCPTDEAFFLATRRRNSTGCFCGDGCGCDFE